MWYLSLISSQIVRSLNEKFGGRVSQFSRKSIHRSLQSRVAFPLLLAALLLSFGVSRDASAAEFYITLGDECDVNYGLIELQPDQLGVLLDLCIANDDNFTHIRAYAWVIEVTDDIDIVSWAPENGSPGNDSVVGELSGTKINGAENTPAPLWVGRLTVDIGLAGGEVWAGSNDQNVMEMPDFVESKVPHTLVPEPRMQLLEAVMLTMLFLLGMSRRQTGNKIC